MSDVIELIDELEAGELAVEFDGEEPRGGARVGVRALRAAHRDLDHASRPTASILIDMAYKIDPEIQVFTVDTGRLPEETTELIETSATATASTCESLHARRHRGRAR